LFWVDYGLQARLLHQFKPGPPSKENKKIAFTVHVLVVGLAAEVRAVERFGPFQVVGPQGDVLDFHEGSDE
jgi:hypothetical protein